MMRDHDVLLREAVLCAQPYRLVLRADKSILYPGIIDKLSCRSYHSRL